MADEGILSYLTVILEDIEHLSSFSIKGFKYVNSWDDTSTKAQFDLETPAISKKK